MDDASKKRRNVLPTFKLGTLFLGIQIQDNSPTFDKGSELK